MIQLVLLITMAYVNYGMDTGYLTDWAGYYNSYCCSRECKTRFNFAEGTWTTGHYNDDSDSCTCVNGDTQQTYAEHNGATFNGFKCGCDDCQIMQAVLDENERNGITTYDQRALWVITKCNICRADFRRALAVNYCMNQVYHFDFGPHGNWNTQRTQSYFQCIDFSDGICEEKGEEWCHNCKYDYHQGSKDGCCVERYSEAMCKEFALESVEFNNEHQLVTAAQAADIGVMFGHLIAGA